jgi:hypothetical protein
LANAICKRIARTNFSLLVSVEVSDPQIRIGRHNEKHRESFVGLIDWRGGFRDGGKKSGDVALL